jgi:hypothetical protein
VAVTVDERLAELATQRLAARAELRYADELRLSDRIERLMALRETVGGAHVLTLTGKET